MLWWPCLAKAGEIPDPSTHTHTPKFKHMYTHIFTFSRIFFYPFSDQASVRWNKNSFYFYYLDRLCIWTELLVFLVVAKTKNISNYIQAPTEYRHAFYISFHSLQYYCDFVQISLETTHKSALFYLIFSLNFVFYWLTLKVCLERQSCYCSSAAGDDDSRCRGQQIDLLQSSSLISTDAGPFVSPLVTNLLMWKCWPQSWAVCRTP